jgi:hypothetical protein
VILEEQQHYELAVDREAVGILYRVRPWRNLRQTILTKIQ